jgi:hypothetical protein
MKIDPKEVWKKAAGRAAAAPGNVAGGAVAVAASAALWNPLPLILWGLGAAGWVLYASTSEGYTRRILDEERRAAEAEAETAREALKAQVGTVLAQPPFSSWIRAGLMPDYLAAFGRLADIRERVNRLLQERQEDYLAGLGIQKQLTYLLTTYLQFVRARVTYLQVLAGDVSSPQAAETAPAAEPARQAAGRAAALPAVPAWKVTRGPRGQVFQGEGVSIPGRPPMTPIGGRPPSSSSLSPSPITPITERLGRAASPVPTGGAGGGAAAVVPALPAVDARLAEIDARISTLQDLAQREPATARTREWHIGILQKQQELLRDCRSRDQQVVAQLTAVPDVFEVILGRVNASQFSVSEVASYMGGVVEQIEETERFVAAMRPAMDEMLVHMEGGSAG